VVVARALVCGAGNLGPTEQHAVSCGKPLRVLRRSDDLELGAAGISA